MVHGTTPLLPRRIRFIGHQTMELALTTIRLEEKVPWGDDMTAMVGDDQALVRSLTMSGLNQSFGCKESVWGETHWSPSHSGLSPKKGGIVVVLRYQKHIWVSRIGNPDEMFMIE